jgi:hypothetical protein
LRLRGGALRLSHIALSGVLLTLIAGCSSGGSSSTPAAVNYTRGAHSGLVTDAANVFGHGTLPATLAYNDTTAASPGTLTFTDGTVLNVNFYVELEPTNLAVQIVPAGSTLPAVVGSVVNTSTAASGAIQYTGSGTEYVYQTSKGVTTPVAQTQAATISFT